LAFYYCDGTSEEKRYIRNVVGCLLRQLFVQTSLAPKDPSSQLISDFQQRYRYAKPPREIFIGRVIPLLESLVKCFRQTYIVVDGLDERAINDGLPNVLVSLARGNVSVLISSRPEVGLETAFSQKPVLEVPKESIKDDISIHIEFHLDHDKIFERIPFKTKLDIKERILERSSGMYMPHCYHVMTLVGSC